MPKVETVMMIKNMNTLKKALKEICIVFFALLSASSIASMFKTTSSSMVMCVDWGPSGTLFVFVIISLILAIESLFIVCLYSFFRKKKFILNTLFLLVCISLFQVFFTFFDNSFNYIETAFGFLKDLGILAIVIVFGVYFLLVVVIYDFLRAYLIPPNKEFKRILKLFFILLSSLCIIAMLFLDYVLCYEPFPRGYLFFFTLFSLLLSLIWFLFIRFLSPR
jgi:hypothetical protein